MFRKCRAVSKGRESINSESKVDQNIYMTGSCGWPRPVGYDESRNWSAARKHVIRLFQSSVRVEVTAVERPVVVVFASISTLSYTSEELTADAS